MKISVIIPVFNEEKYLEKTLESLTNQKVKADEVIVVDNNSIDNSLKIAKKFLKKLPLKIIQEKRQGTTLARNKGFEKAKGEILVKLDADTILKNDVILKIKNDFLKFEKIDGITCYVNFYDTPILKKTNLYFDFYMWLAKIFLKTYIFGGPIYAIKKRSWQKVKTFICLDDKKVHEDIDLSIHLKKINGKIYFDRDIVVYSSGRRIKYQPWSFFIEYPLRFLRMFFTHYFF